jgi:hypothetical protein
LLLGGLTVGALAQATDADERNQGDNPLVRQPEIETPDDLGQQTEISVPTEGGEPSGELGVPDSAQTGEVETPDEPAQRGGEVPVPTDQSRDPFTLRAAEQEQQERDEEDEDTEDDEDEEDEDEEDEEERQRTIVDIPPELVPDDPVAIGGGEEPRDSADAVETIIPTEEPAEEREGGQENLEPPAERGPFERSEERDRTPVRGGFGDTPALDEDITEPTIESGTAELFGERGEIGGAGTVDDPLAGLIGREDSVAEPTSQAEIVSESDATATPDVDVLVDQTTDTAQVSDQTQVQQSAVTSDILQTPAQSFDAVFGEPTGQRTQTRTPTEPREPTEPTSPGGGTGFGIDIPTRTPRFDEDDEDDEPPLFATETDDRRFDTGILTPGEDETTALFGGDESESTTLDDLI